MTWLADALQPTALHRVSIISVGHVTSTASGARVSTWAAFGRRPNLPPSLSDACLQPRACSPEC
jgi:hypothetical protein